MQQTWKKRAKEDTSLLGERIGQVSGFSTLSTGDRPTLPQLMALKCPDGTEIGIIERTSPNWDYLGLGLDFEGHVLQTINQNAFHQFHLADRAYCKLGCRGGVNNQ